MHAYRIPGPPLCDFVELFWFYEEPPLAHPRERLMPSGSMELVISLLDDECVLSGPYSETFVIDTSRPRRLVGVHFKPGGAFPFLGTVPAGELHNVTLSLEDVWGASGARELRERLLAATDKFAVLEDALLARARTFERHEAVAYAIRQFDRLASVGSVLDSIGLSQRRFIDVFARETGYTPKLYARVRRFQRVLRSLHTAREVDWSEVALACGYYDQPHFNRDFRAFSGLSPTEYFAQRTEHLNHVPLA